MLRTIAPRAALAIGLLATAGAASGAGEPALELVLDGAPVELEAAAEAEIVATLLDYFAPCRPYADVVAGEQPDLQALTDAWCEIEAGDHARLRAAPAVEGHGELGGEPFTLLLGLADRRAPGAVLTLAADGGRTSYAKCPGLDGLLLVCRIRELAPGVEMHEGCEQVRRIARNLHNGRTPPAPAEQ